MKDKEPYHIKSISEFHSLRKLPGPAHPLVSVLRFEDMRELSGDHPQSWVLDFYAIALKRNFDAKLKYGQQAYDFDEGIMTFMAPGQKIGIEAGPDQVLEHSGWLLIFHPDFLWHTSLAKTIKQHEFFDYSVKEALFLSEQEEQILTDILQNIRREYHARIDSFTQNIIIGQLEVLLNYSDRFYQRQFITRKASSHDILIRLENLLTERFENNELAKKGLPSVSEIAGALHVSPNYLSGLLKTLTGKSTQHHLHDVIVHKAKEKLSGTNKSVSEIAYELGFDYPQSFSKLFKANTNLSPIEFRQSFN
ncbi:AraC family transcriptional regulator [Dyadobacter sp. CY347]|uniref:helix-turn-helix domain-containing protein n=1 Tax=Dyadobacter sp. CY347 TaxID=2909336 RepID=UPI001F18A52E|nr:response regulator transcription factor [Dyadobacter sp. CY347]MCF2489229.1 helix-turn-helix transcriptional regulator [Dyadobacter sp. CY347]